MFSSIATLEGKVNTLLREGHEYAQNGRYWLACERYASAWSQAQGNAPQLADSAAWAMTNLLAKLHHYSEAKVWFDRVRNMPPEHDWESERELLEALFAQIVTKPAVTSTATTPHNETLTALTVQCLSRFRITRGGVPLGALGKRKALSVFRYLLTCHDYSAYRDELIEAIWADAPADNAQHSLHVAVNTLRRYLDLPDTPSYLVFENGCYMLHPDASITIDSQVFEAGVKAGERSMRQNDPRAAEAALIVAVGLYGGDYDVYGDETGWASAERERLFTLYLDALDHLGKLYLHENRCEDALIYYRRLAERDSYREDVHHHLITCYLQMGRRHEALRQFELCLSILHNELQIEPSTAFMALYAQIVA